MIETITTKGEPDVARSAEVEIDHATAGAVATGTRREHGCIDLSKCGRTSGRVHRTAVEGAPGTAARKGIEQLRCHLVCIDRNQARQAAGCNPGTSVGGGELGSVRSTPWRPHNRGSAGVHGDRAAIVGIANTLSAVRQWVPVAAAVGGIGAEVAGTGGVGGGGLCADDEVRILPSPVQAANTARYRIGVHPRLRRDIEVE